MDKGLLVIVALGAAFIYFAINMFNTSSGEHVGEWSSSTEKSTYGAYYQKDVIGENVLNLNSVPLAQAKTIWSTTPTSEKIANIVPDFDMARAELDNAIVDGKFKSYLLRYLEKIKGSFMAGEIESKQAKKSIMYLK